MHVFKIIFLLLLIACPLKAQHRVDGFSSLIEYLPVCKTSTAVVVCPGGSYCWLSKKYEGSEVAKWLNANGIAAYVLYYPTAGWAGFAWHSRLIFRGHQYPDQIEAIEKAMKIVRSKGYDKVGMMGFSAGGHLVICAAEYLQQCYKPDFVASLYPVVTFSRDNIVHRRSRRGLLGERRWRNKSICDSLSVEKHANLIQCPLFIANCKDDPIVDYRNSELMDSALNANHKPHLYIQYKTGGHGFGTTASKTSAEAIKWKERFLDWIKGIDKIIK